MEQFRGYEFTAAVLAVVVASQEPAILTVGRSKVGKLFVLPCATWTEAVVDTYDEGTAAGMRRVTTRTSKEDGLDEGTLLGVLVEQVDEEGKMIGDACLVVTLKSQGVARSQDAAFVVPANEYWRGVVEERRG